MTADRLDQIRERLNALRTPPTPRWSSQDREDVGALLAVAEAAGQLLVASQAYTDEHEDDSHDEQATCSICTALVDAETLLEAALAALSEGEPAPVRLGEPE